MWGEGTATTCSKNQGVCVESLYLKDTCSIYTTLRLVRLPSRMPVLKEEGASALAELCCCHGPAYLKNEVVPAQTEEVVLNAGKQDTSLTATFSYLP